MQIELLADNPFLISTIGELRWKEWGHPPEPDRIEDWIEITSKEAGRNNLPITRVTIDENASAIGAVRNGYSQLWGGTEGRAVDFYRKCGGQIFEDINRPSGEIVTILIKTL